MAAKTGRRLIRPRRIPPAASLALMATAALHSGVSQALLRQVLRLGLDRASIEFAFAFFWREVLAAAVAWSVYRLISRRFGFFHQAHNHNLFAAVATLVSLSLGLAVLWVHRS